MCGTERLMKPTEHHYHITTLDWRKKAHYFLAYTQDNRPVENNLHRQLDVNFHENLCRIRNGYGAENFSRLDRIALNMLKKE